ncbi:RNA-binding S4 domain-containing protein, partial [Enterococcus faecalis]|nr:RNA-binding S4 domain-containing protein [Enterococcus faecalis]
GQDENRRGKKIRIGDVVELPTQHITIKMIEPTAEEINQYLEDKAEKERVAALVKSLNKENNKRQKPQKQGDSKLTKPAVRFPGT